MAQRADKALQWLWDSGASSKPRLDAELIWARGSRGFSAQDEVFARSDEDVADFRQRLEQLCRSLREEANLNALGLTMAFGQLTAAVRRRHVLGKMWRGNPGIWETPLAPPIIVIGQMRAGTTRMHRLLAADPAHAGTRLCNGMDPIRHSPDLRALKCRIGLEIARRINPWMDAQHPFGAKRVDEELPWLSFALDACAYEVQYRIPSYVAFSEARDASAIYREMSRILRSDAAMMRNAALPRVLKCPQYAEDMDALLTQFPDARVVVTRRDAEEVLASAISVVASQMAYQSDHADLAQIEQEWQRKLALREARMEQDLARLCSPVAEVDFTALSADWLREITRVYRELGISLSVEAVTAMRAEQGRASHSPHHAHRQSYAKPAKIEAGN